MEFYREKFKEIRKNLRWSVNDLAKAAGISRQSIYYWEKGTKTPSEKTVRQIADIMHIKVSQIADLIDFCKVSEENFLDTFINMFRNEDLANNYISTIKSTLNTLEESLTRTISALKILLTYTQNIFYVKDVNQEYVLGNNSLRRVLGLNSNFIFHGKKDCDFFTKKDALLNTDQDQIVLNSGKPTLNYEQYIIGTRKKAWGVYNRVPIFDNKKRIKGVLCVIVDITERIEGEKYRRILENSLSNIKGFVWIGKGINMDTEDYPFRFCKKVLYTTTKLSNIPEIREFVDNSPNHKSSFNDFKKKWQAAMPIEVKSKIYEIKKKHNFPAALKYIIRSPISNTKIYVSEEVNYFPEEDIFVGYISFVKHKHEMNMLYQTINDIPNMIIWNAVHCEKKLFKYIYISNIEKITGYSDSFFLNDGNCLYDLAVDPNIKIDLSKKINNNLFPISETFFIKDKNGNKKHVHAYYFKNNSNTQAYRYYGYYILSEI